MNVLSATKINTQLPVSGLRFQARRPRPDEPEFERLVKEADARLTGLSLEQLGALYAALNWAKGETHRWTGHWSTLPPERRAEESAVARALLAALLRLKENGKPPKNLPNKQELMRLMAEHANRLVQS